MTNLISVTFATVCLLILQKYRTESVQLLSPNEESLVSHGYEKGKRQKDGSVLSDNLKASFPENENEVVSEGRSEIKGSHKILIEAFGTQFTNAILSSNQLSEMYDTSLPPDEASQAYYRIVLNAKLNVNTEFARALTLIVSSAIKETFDRLTLTKHVQTYGYSVAKFLVSMKVLTRENLRELCDAYVGFNKAEAKYIPRIPDRRLVNIQAITNSLLHFLSSLKIYKGSSMELLCRVFANTLYKLTAVGLQRPKRLCSEHNVVDVFASKVVSLVSASPKLAEMFDTTLTPIEAQDAYKRLVYNAVVNVHTTDPIGITLNVSNAILDNFGSLNSTQQIQADVYTAARYLKSKNFLTCENVHQLCDSYISYLEEAVKNVPWVPDRRDEFIQARVDAFLHFMTSLKLYTGNTVVHLSYYFVDSLYALSGIPFVPHNSPSCPIIDIF